jgi:hypothetical protein
VKHEGIDKLRSRKNSCSSEEWESILTALLLDGEPVPNIHAVAKVGDSALSIEVSQRIQNINVRA